RGAQVLLRLQPSLVEDVYDVAGASDQRLNIGANKAPTGFRRSHRPQFRLMSQNRPHGEWAHHCPEVSPDAQAGPKAIWGCEAGSHRREPPKTFPRAKYPVRRFLRAAESEPIRLVDARASSWTDGAVRGATAPEGIGLD